MAVTLYVERDAWLAHIRATWAALGDPVPVVKGNGYGLGRQRLAQLAVDLGADEIAVGTTHEVTSVPAGPIVVALTPALRHDLDPVPNAVLTVGSVRHVDEAGAAGFRGRVVVKLASPMRRFGARPEDLDAVLAAVARAGLEVHAFALHLPLATTPTENVASVRPWLTALDPEATLLVSHLGPGELDQLRTEHPRGTVRVRAGTALWHGDKSWFRLAADVLDARPVRAGTPTGYQQVRAPGDGHVVLVAGGTAHGVHPLAGDRSPFHHRRQRLALLEPPHMHTSMLFVPEGDPVPAVGAELDLQRPLTQTWPDRVIER